MLFAAAYCALPALDCCSLHRPLLEPDGDPAEQQQQCRCRRNTPAPESPGVQQPMPPRAFHPHTVRAHRPGNVLDLLLTPIVQLQPNLALKMVIGRPGNQYAPGFAELLETGGDVDAVP